MSLTLPIGMHDRARALANAERAATGKIVNIGDIYAAAISALTARIEAGEEIVFAAHPKGGIRRHSIRVTERTAAQSIRFARVTTQSSFVATAMRHYITHKETYRG